jgi:aspartate kinase
MSPKIIVVKFGGTSQSKEGYQSCLRRLKEDKDCCFIVCVSAVSGVTNLLLEYTQSPKVEIVEKVIKKHLKLLEDLEMEYFGNIIKNMIHLMFSNYQDNLQGKIDLIKMGEKLSSLILTDYLESNKAEEISNSGTEYQWFTEVILYPAEEIIKSTRENNTLYQLTNIEFNPSFEELFRKNRVIVTQGFMGGTPSNKTFLLGRGGSDTTGAIIAHFVNASSYEIWTDVNGMYQVDPRLFPSSPLFEKISYEMAQELAAMGAKVLHPYCIKPCQEKNIPIIIRNSFGYENPYTVITNLNNSHIGLTLQKNNTLFKIKSMSMWCHSGFVYEIFKVFKDLDIDIDIISTSQFEVSTTTKETNLDKLRIAEDNLKKKFLVEIKSNLDLISLVYPNILKLDVSHDLLKDYSIYLMSHSSNDISLSFLVNPEDSLNILKNLYQCYRFS